MSVDLKAAIASVDNIKPDQLGDIELKTFTYRIMSNILVERNIEIDPKMIKMINEYIWNQAILKQ